MLSSTALPKTRAPQSRKTFLKENLMSIRRTRRSAVVLFTILGFFTAFLLGTHFVSKASTESGPLVENQTSQGTAPDLATGKVTMHAAGRGKPLYNLSDGTQMPVTFRGLESAVEALSLGLAEPRALSSGDLDRNGTPDVVAGYAYNGAGIITIQQGNPDPYAPADDSI